VRSSIVAGPNLFSSIALSDQAENGRGADVAAMSKSVRAVALRICPIAVVHLSPRSRHLGAYRRVAYKPWQLLKTVSTKNLGRRGPLDC